MEHWSNALNGGKAAARAMLGEPVSYDRLPYFFTDQYDLGMEYTGWVEPGGYDRVVFRGDPTIRPGVVPDDQVERVSDAIKGCPKNALFTTG